MVQNKKIVHFFLPDRLRGRNPAGVEVVVGKFLSARARVHVRIIVSSIQAEFDDERVVDVYVLF